MKEYRELVEAYQKVYEQQKIGIPLDAPTDAAAVRKLKEILPPSERDKVIVPKSSLQKAHYEPEGEVIDESEIGDRARKVVGDQRQGVHGSADAIKQDMDAINLNILKLRPYGIKGFPSAKKDIAKTTQVAHYEPEGEIVSEDIFDKVLEYLISEGCTVEESKYIMTYVVEQGMHPQEVIGRGIANLLGFDKPHPTEVFARGLKKMLYPNKPVEVKAPKPPVKAAVKPTTSKPNPYRPGATVRATGPNMDKFPELKRFADQGRKVAEPVAKTLGAAAAVKNVTPAGVAAAVMSPRPTGDATLSGALKRGDYKPKQGPKNPDQGLTRSQSFDKAYKVAKQKGGMGSTFTWNNRNYKVY
jgi:hypothetical protein